VIQAGGNCGVWAVRFAAFFKRVYTFEPDPVNYKALMWNVKDYPDVITPFPFALTSKPKQRVSMVREDRNCGAHQITFNDQSEGLPTITIDDMAMPGDEEVDLIYLDIEGAEMLALRGAEETIRRARPVIAFEDKGLSIPFGYRQGDIEKWLASEFGYKVKYRPNRDVIMVPD